MAVSQARIYSALLRVTPILVSVICASAGCVTVTTFDELVTVVSNADTTLTLCPFEIAKPAGSTLLLANKVLRMTCERTSNTDKCSIVGQGNIIRIQGPRSDVMIDGFTFQGATQAAIRIAPTSVKTHTLHNCDFLENEGSIDDGWRGGAIKTEPGTSLVVSACSFIGNAGAQGGAIFHRGDFLSIVESSFEDNLARQGGAIKVDEMAFVELQAVFFVNNRATKFLGGALAVEDGSSLLSSIGLTGEGNMPCNGIHDEVWNTCEFFGSSNNNTGVGGTFNLGKLTIMDAGLRLSRGMKVKIIAGRDELVEFTSPGTTSDRSTIPFHQEPDGAAVFELDDGGWVYVSNSELRSSEGGVYALEFDSQGRSRDYAARLEHTTRNCAGGVTPWHTWVSCEEYGRGQCWQVDPTGKQAPEQTKLVEEAGGNFESMAVDYRNSNKVEFFVTEDHPKGALRRFRPCDGANLDWDMLHKDGTLDYLEFLPGRKFRWTSLLATGRESAAAHYPNVEGISHENGILSFVSKVKKQIFRLDLDHGTYTIGSTYREQLGGGGSFGAGPDQLIQYGDMLYFTEDGGKSPGVFVWDGSRFYALFEAYDSKYFGDETTGLAFSPDGTKLYVCLQEIGYLFQLEREDGLPFEGGRRLLGMKYHLDRAQLKEGN